MSAGGPAVRRRRDAPADLHAGLTAARQRRALLYALFALLTSMLLVVTMATAPRLFPVASVLLMACAGAVLVQPRLGLFVVMFLGLIGDLNMAGWYPFAKNLSSRESALFLHDAAILSPLELFLLLTLVSWLLHRLDTPDVPILVRGPLLAPMLAFTGFVAFAFVHGVGRGGAFDIALWEVRPIAYVPIVYLLALNLLTTRRDRRRLAWTIAAALCLEGVHAVWVASRLDEAATQAAQVAGYLEHSASLHFDLLFVWLAAMFVFGERRRPKLALACLLVPIAWIYLLAERRSAVVALIGAMLLLTAVLYTRRRRLFWVVVPLTAIAVAAYVAAFWNAWGPLAFPAQAVKTVIAPGQLAAADQSSNLYRAIETYNIVSTIRAYPVFGSGFGHPFLRVLPLPEIPFIWADYFPHNAVLWIWMNAGVGGFVSMLLLFTMTIRSGVRVALRAVRPSDGALLMAFTLFVPMYVIYAYVDIAWDTQSMLLLGLVFAVVTSAAREDAAASRPGDREGENRVHDASSARPSPPPRRLEHATP